MNTPVFGNFFGGKCRSNTPVYIRNALSLGSPRRQPNPQWVDESPRLRAHRTNPWGYCPPARKRTIVSEVSFLDIYYIQDVPESKDQIKQGHMQGKFQSFYPYESRVRNVVLQSHFHLLLQQTRFDDEFDEFTIETNALAGRGRDIPDDEDLDEPARDVIHAVERAMDTEADRLLGVSPSFVWEKDFESFRGVPEVFSGPTPGPLKDYDNPYDAFTDIWTNDIMELIAQETNRYANQTIESMKANGTLKPSSRLHQWHDTNADEIAVLFAVFMYMGIDNRSCQYEYWKANDYLEMLRFRELLPYNRFLLLNRFLHFVDNSDVSQNLSHSEGVASKKLAKLQPVISHLSSKFSSLYNLRREISIDESLTLFKGRLSFVQTIRSKAARFGIKSYELCESKTGYLYKFFIYTGKNSDNSFTVVAPSDDLGGKTTQVVLGLLKDLERRGHCVTMDNFYNCPSLARYLKSLGFDCLGTLRLNRKHVPRDVNRIPKNVEKGTIMARQCGDVSVIAWKDAKLVTMISTYHTPETYIGSKAGKVLVKPVCVKDYNNTMGGVDLKDQKLSMYLLERKRGVKWYIKMFKRLLNVSIHNAFIMYTSSLSRRNKDALTHRDFRYSLAKSLVDAHHHSPPVIREQIGEVMRLRRDVVHEPKYEPGRNNRKRCKVCYRQKIDKMVHSQCVTCGEYLCFGTCWREWHSLPKLKGQEFRGRQRSRN
ncbi:hypothetical protein ABMA28_017247 [Loxostege sticticalis]|uniref:PiggyBac transposable element-derived protein domain-containing protein n=1 Tax=Loxostege sticticalis TaxID=481309 RepID=A0ABD0S316_LOXSC